VPPRLDIEIDISSEDGIKSGAVKVLHHVRPDWSDELINWKIFSDGITNKLVGAWQRDRKMDTVLVRVYGLGTEKIIDRTVELKNMLKMQDLGLGSKVYASFINGLCYEFQHGEILSQCMLGEKSTYRAVARMMAKMHSIPVDIKKPLIWDRLDRFVSLCNPIDERLKLQWMNHSQLRKEVDLMRSLLEKCSSPVVFCHNDVLLANVVLNKSGHAVFIDLEYGGPSYAAYDIANHFVEYVGCDGKLDYPKWLPSKEYQMDWISEYLKHRDGYSGESADTLFVEVQQFMLCAHLLWSIWAVIQAENSDIDFDFVGYALQRYLEYKRWKMVLGIESNASL